MNEVRTVQYGILYIQYNCGRVHESFAQYSIIVQYSSTIQYMCGDYRPMKNGNDCPFPLYDTVLYCIGQNRSRHSHVEQSSECNVNSRSLACVAQLLKETIACVAQ